MPILALAVVACLAGCHKDQDQNAQNPTVDPSTANLAPASSDGSNTLSNTPQDSSTANNSAPQQYAPQSNSNGGANGSYGSAPDMDDAETANGQQPVETADAAPPALPDYDQPEAPGDGYLWTPGYWNHAPAGYYWVPGAWVQAPYQGALWTPGYWGYRHHHYEFFRGYWGLHIGFYGGVNYGFGYTGDGYRGGYWNHDHFNYNRSVNHINVSLVHNVYNFDIPRNDHMRVSFNGGSGGVMMRPRPAEIAAWREPHAAPMAMQLRHEEEARGNRQQFVEVNHGRPTVTIAAHPLMADRDVRPVAAAPMRMQEPIRQGQPQPMVQQHQSVMQHQMPAQPQHQPVAQPQHQAPASQQHQPVMQQHQMPAPQQHQPAPQPQHQAPAPQHSSAAPQPQHQSTSPRDEHHPHK
jgi:hypothetical protein